MEKPRLSPAARLLSLREYARTRNVALFTVQAAIRDGRITTTPDADGKPKIDPATADAQFLANTDPSKQGRAKSLEPPSSAPGAGETAQSVQSPPAPPPPAANTYQHHRTEKEGYEAKLRRLKYLEQKGRLIPADQVRDAALKLGRQLRDSVLNLPDRLSAILAAETDPQRVNAILTDELTKALEALHREIGGD